MTAAWALLGTASLPAQQPKPSEYQVKAAYLYNFGRFVGWPARGGGVKGGAFEICLLGQDPFGPILDEVIAGDTIDGKKVVAKRVSRPPEALNCRILFIGSSEAAHLQEILGVLDKASVLTVSEIPQFAAHGGMIQFLIEGNRVRFEVNLTVAENAGLTLSSELLKVALSVRRNSQPGD